jgi:hypothetical protein
MNWCFATINNRLGEIYFEKKKTGRIKFLGHCYIKKEDFKIKKQRNVLEEDIKKFKIIYRNKKYRLIG